VPATFVPVGEQASDTAAKPRESASQAGGLSVKTWESSPMNESEWQTREQHIDTGLRFLGPLWKIIR
jgi:hypothetical protein